MQTGVIKVNGKTYCLNKAGALESGKVAVMEEKFSLEIYKWQVASTSAQSQETKG